MTRPFNHDRNEVMIAAISVVCGHSNGTPVESSMLASQAQAIIDDRYKAFDLGHDDRRMTAAEMRDLVTGNTIYGAPYNNDPYVFSFLADGQALLKLPGRPLERGQWRIDEQADTISSQWERAAGGKELVVEYHRTADPDVYKNAIGAVPITNWNMFLVVPGIALDVPT